MEIVIKMDEDIVQGIIDGENDAPRNIVRAFQATIADAIKDGTPLETQPTDKCKGCYYNDGETHAECVVCDKEEQPTDTDCISRQAVLDYAKDTCLDLDKYEDTEVFCDEIKAMPPVKPKYTDEEIDRAQAVEQAYVDKMVELAVEEVKRPKGKWISVNDNDSHGWGAYKCHVCSECKDYYTTSAYEMKYCPNCGAEMEGGREDA